jgi:hypothetical protein
MKEKKAKQRYIKMPNKANKHIPFDWQGKSKESIELSYKIVFVFGLIFASWICAYGLYKFGEWLLIQF